jgi:hypothetical protein
MDFNSHMRNTAYLDKSADARMMYFSENGFFMQEYMPLRLGPVIMRDELNYYREVSLLEELRAALELAALAADGMRFAIQNSFLSTGRPTRRTREKHRRLARSHGAKTGCAARRITDGSATGASLRGVHGSSFKPKSAKG